MCIQIVLSFGGKRGITAHTVDEHGGCVLGTLLVFSDHTLNDHHAVYDSQGAFFFIIILFFWYFINRLLSLCLTGTCFLWWEHHTERDRDKRILEITTK